MAAAPIKHKGEPQCFSLKCLATGHVKSFLLMDLLCSVRGWDASPLYILHYVGAVSFFHVQVVKPFTVMIKPLIR